MAEDRLDRIERNLERYAEESNQRMTRLERNAEESKQRMTHLERILANFSRDVARNAAGANERLDQIEKLVARNAQLIERNGQQIQFLRELTQGHISQPTPPAHAD